MSLRLNLLTLWLRNAAKPALARTRSVASMRAGLTRAAALLSKSPAIVRWDETLTSNRRLVWTAAAGADGSTRRGKPHAASGSVILYLHGGAYLAGAPETHQALIAALAASSDTPVAALAYRRAPEDPFPAAFEDAVAAYDTLIARMGAPNRVALAGDSAGGGLALAVAAARSGRASPARPAAVACFSPWTDLAITGGSIRRNARRDALLPAHRLAEAATLYLQGADPKDPRASPLYAAWRSPPPVLLQVGSNEILYDDAARTAAALRAAGGDVRLEVFRRAPHALAFFAPILAEGAGAAASAGQFLKKHLSPDSAAP